MAKKKSKPRSASPKKPGRSKSGSPPAPKSSESREPEGDTKGLLRLTTVEHSGTPQERAQDLVYEAFESREPGERVGLARKALDVFPDCADAYLLLAEEAGSRKEALELYAQGVAAAERALGPGVFRDSAGDFWGLLETRPYMRAREGLANLLWVTGRRDEAVAHLQDMLRLNPGDNQGLRYTLCAWLLAEGRDEDLGRLLNEYDEDTAMWVYPKALATFRRHGDTAASRKLLQKARKANRYVPDYLTGKTLIPSESPALYSPGSKDEAILYAAESLAGWKSTPGAIAWLKQSAPASKAKKAPEAAALGPLPLALKRLEKLPRVFDVWQADAHPFGHRVEEQGELIRPWLVLVTSHTHSLVLAQAMTLEPPTPDLVWDQLAEAMKKPMAGKPHRPTEVQVRPGGVFDRLVPHLDEIGVRAVPTDELDQIDFLFKQLDKEMSAEEPPGLLEMPGVEAAGLAGFYRAAADFYRKAPWRRLGYETAIRVACDRYQSGPWYAVVMGQGGLTTGVALYDDFAVLKKLWSGEMSDEENARETVALTVTFDDETEVPDADLDAIEEYQFDVAGREAYPSVFRKERGMSMRPPLAWELELMEACLLAIPRFVAEHPPDDTATHPVTVSTGSGELTLELSWAEG